MPKPIFAALAIPDQRGFGRFLPVAGNHMNSGLVIEQFGLALVFDDDQSESLLRLVHAMQGLGHRTIRVVLPGRFGDGFDGFQRGAIQSPANGKGLAGRIEVVEDAGLVTR